MHFENLASVTLSVAVIAAIALFLGGLKVARQAEGRRRGLLMIVAALVLAGNVLILAWPSGS